MVKFTRKKYTNKRRKLNKKLKLKKSKKRVLKRKQSNRLSRKNRRIGGKKISTKYNGIAFDNSTFKRNGEILNVRLPGKNEYEEKNFHYVEIPDRDTRAFRKPTQLTMGTFVASLIKFHNDDMLYDISKIDIQHKSVNFSFIPTSQLIFNEQKTIHFYNEGNYGINE